MYLSARMHIVLFFIVFLVKIYGPEGIVLNLILIERIIANEEKTDFNGA